VRLCDFNDQLNNKQTPAMMNPVLITSIWRVVVTVEVSCSSPRSTRDFIVMARRRRFYFADKLVYMCRRGLVPVSEPVLTCTSTGHWDRSPRCKGLTAGLQVLLCCICWLSLADLGIEHSRVSVSEIINETEWINTINEFRD